MAEDIVITRTINAPVEAVWKAWTTPALVKKWWGPKGFYAPSIKVDFRVGGRYIFAMHGPKGSPWDKDLYSAGVYKEIVPNEKIVVIDYFSDSKGNKTSPTEHGLANNMPQEMVLRVKFEVVDGKTKLSIIYPKPESEETYQVMIKSGMQEGWGTSLDKLAKVVEETS